MTYVHEEPARGAPMPPAAYALPGLDIQRGWARGLWPPTAGLHLTGYQASQALNGSFVASMPITPWLAHADGSIEVGVGGEVTAMLAAHTTVGPGKLVVPVSCTYTPLRRVTPEDKSLISRATVLRTSRTWAAVSFTVEDGRGRTVVDGSAHFEITDAGVPLPEATPRFEAVEPPRYPTPDPYRRPVPPDAFEVFDRWVDEGGAETARQLIEGTLAPPPLNRLVGYRLVEAGEGRFVNELVASPWLGHMVPVLTSGYVSAVAVDAAVGATWMAADRGKWPQVMSFSILHSRSVPVDGRTLRFEGTAEHRGGDLVSAHVRVTDGDGVVAEASGALRLRAATQRPQRARATRALATVLFTDIVDSTQQGAALGDSGWAATLEGHDAIVRRRLEEFDGREIKTTGDGFLATFDSPTSAVECAGAIATDVLALGIAIRAGIHTGECEFAAGDVTGVAVNTAARVEAAAGPGEVWVSETTRALTAGSGLAFSDQGEHELKGLDEPMRLYRVE